ncbi:MAG: fatty acyl-AMP ligase [Pseudomonadota bacterium]
MTSTMFNRTMLTPEEIQTAAARLPVQGSLALRAWSHPDKTLFTFLDEQGEESDHFTYLQLWQTVEATRALLEKRSAAGDRVILFFPPGLKFIAAFLGCLLARRIAVPINLPTRRRVDRCLKIIGDSGVRLALAPRDQISGLQAIFESSSAATLSWAAAEDAVADPTLKPQQADLQQALNTNEIAFLQYTSGSTSNPKGVMVTHANITCNLRMMRDIWSLNHTTDMVFWQPHHHDMGLILGQLLPVVLGNHSVLMAPNTFVRQPSLWLHAISKYRAVLAGGPNFAYELASERFNADKLEGIDLSCWKLALNGADVVRSATLERFCNIYEPYGFAPETFIPCYGLAEATLFVSGGPPGRPVSRTDLDGDSLENDRRVVAPKSQQSRRCLVGCGESPWDLEVAIVDPTTSERLPSNGVGEIWLSGPSMAAGYWQNEQATANTFRATVKGEPGKHYMRTGDLGFVGADYQVYICGRLKDLIISDGRNLHPEDIEHSIALCNEALRARSCAVFSHEGTRNGQRIIAAIEVDRGLVRLLQDQSKVLRTAIRTTVSHDHDVALDEILFVPPSAMCKTTSGKVQRSLMRQAYLAGDLEVIDH